MTRVVKKVVALIRRILCGNEEVPTNGSNHIESSSVVTRTVTVAPIRPFKDIKEDSFDDIRYSNFLGINVKHVTSKRRNESDVSDQSMICARHCREP